MMVSREFNISDLSSMNTWLIARNLPQKKIMDLPVYGLIVEGLAVGFLVETDSCFALLDFFVSNPEADRNDRKVALTMIAAEMVEIAKEKGFETLLTYSKIAATQAIAADVGFKFANVVNEYFMELA